MLRLDLDRPGIGFDQRKGAGAGEHDPVAAFGADICHPLTKSHEASRGDRRQHRPSQDCPPPVHHISSAGVTPITPNPDAITSATPRTNASRAKVSSSSPPAGASTMKRTASSLPRFQWP